jgi:LCP family protein required for cell wall assembly
MGSTPIAAAPLTVASRQAPSYQVPPDATATATPFQPIPPTPVYIPTEFPTPTSTLPPVEVAAAQSEERVGPVTRPKDQVNILLLGSDARPYNRIFRTDAIILLSLNPSLGTANMLSFPRDMYVHIPGFGMDRINTAWARGGFSKLAATFDHNFGFRPDHYVLINFSSFKRLVDSLGGLDVTVGKRLTDYYRGRSITIPAGKKHMNADMVLWYARSRKTSSDFARNRRQQEVLRALADKFISLDALRRAPEFYAIYSSSVKTNLSLLDLLPLLPLGAQLASDSSRIKHHFIGGIQVSSWITPGGAAVLTVDKAAMVKKMKRVLGGN